MLTAVGRRFRALTPYGQRMAHQAMQALRERARTNFVSPHRFKIPPGYRVATASEAAMVLAEHIPARVDAAATRRAINAALVSLLRFDYNGRIIGGHERIAALAGGRRVSRSCVGNHVRALIRAGVLHVVQRGSSAAVNGLGRNIAPTYVVLIDENRLGPEDQALVDRLNAQITTRERHLPEGVVDSVTLRDDQGRIGGKKPRSMSLRREHPERFQPRSRRERNLSICWLAGVWGFDVKHHGADLHRAAVAFFKAGWSAEAIAYAATHDRRAVQDETRLTDAVWSMRLLNWRLSRWRDTDRQPVAPPVLPATPRRGPRRAVPELPRTLRPLWKPGISDAGKAALAAMRAGLRAASA